MLALETGWTPDVIAELPHAFRAACHWTLFGRTIAGAEGFPNTDIPRNAPAEVKMAALEHRVQVDAQRKILFPEGTDGDA